jgi:hypothetical protein
VSKIIPSPSVEGVPLHWLGSILLQEKFPGAIATPVNRFDGCSTKTAIACTVDEALIRSALIYELDEAVGTVPSIV